MDPYANGIFFTRNNLRCYKGRTLVHPDGEKDYSQTNNQINPELIQNYSYNQGVIVGSQLTNSPSLNQRAISD